MMQPALLQTIRINITWRLLYDANAKNCEGF